MLPPAERARDVEERLRRLFPDGTPPAVVGAPAAPPDADRSIEALGTLLRQTPPAGTPGLPPRAALAAPRPDWPDTCRGPAAGPAADDLRLALAAAQAALGATYDQASERLLAGDPSTERLAGAVLQYTQVLAERPAPPRTSFLLERLPGWLRSVVRLVATDAPPVTPAEHEQALARWAARHEAAARDLHLADQERRAVIDAFVATPGEAVRELVTQSRLLGRTARHPLLRPADVEVAERTLLGILEHPERVAALRRMATGPAVTPEERDRVGFALFGELTGEASRLWPTDIPMVGPSPDAQAAARALGRRLVEVAPRLVATLDRTLAAAAEGGEATRLDALRAGAQVLYAELVPKEALIEGRKLASPTSRVADVALGGQGVERRLLVDPRPDLVRVQPLERVPEPTVAAWRQTLGQAKADIARTTLGLVALEHATPAEKTLLDRDALGGRLVAAAQQLAREPATPEAAREIARAVAALPPLRARADQLRIAATEIQAASPPDAALRLQPVTQELARLQPALEASERAVASATLLDPGLRTRLVEWRPAADTAAQQGLALARSPQARDAEFRLVAQKTEEHRVALESLVLPLLPGPREVTTAVRVAALVEWPGGASIVQAGPGAPGRERIVVGQGGGASITGGPTLSAGSLAGSPAPGRDPVPAPRSAAPRIAPEQEAPRPADGAGRTIVQAAPVGIAPLQAGRVLGPGLSGSAPGATIAGGPGAAGLVQVGPWDAVADKLQVMAGQHVIQEDLSRGLVPTDRLQAGRTQLQQGMLQTARDLTGSPSLSWPQVQQATGIAPRPVHGGVTAMAELERRFRARHQAFLDHQERMLQEAERRLEEQVAQAQAQGRTASFSGAVYRRSRLSDPSFLAQLYTARMGGWGWAHSFKDEDELAQFVRSRLGPYGIVHTRTNLDDPQYLMQLFRSRVGGLGWIHQFKDEDELKQFIQSRLGPYGRGMGCADLAKSGFRPDQIQAIFDDAKKYGKKDFESDAAYRQRMQAEHPDQFTVTPSGDVRRKTERELQADRREAMLASGNWVEDPETGTLVPKDSRRGREITAERRTTVEIQLADGSRLQVTTEGVQSLWDAMTDTLRGRGYWRDGTGTWRDRNGRMVLSPDKALEYDQRYLDAKSKADPGFKERVTYSPSERIIPPPPTPAQELAALQSRIKANLGYEIRGVDVGGQRVDLQVKPGQSVSDAMLAHLQAGGRRVGYDDFGNIVDLGSGRVVVPRSATERLNHEYDRRLTEAVFGEGADGFAREVEHLARDGSPAQQARAQAILQSLGERADQLAETVRQQDALQAQLRALGDRSRLGAAQRAEYDRLAGQLATATEQRRQIETGLIEQTQTANRSARQAVAQDLGYFEREALRANQAAGAAADAIAELDWRLARPDLTPTERRNLEGRRADLVEDLVRAGRREAETRERVTAPAERARLDGLTRPIDAPPSVVLSRTEAMAQAQGVVYEGEGPSRVAYALDAAGRRLVDAAGQPIRLSADEGRGVERRVETERQAAEAAAREAALARARWLAAQQPAIELAARRVNETDAKIRNYDEMLAGIPDTPENAAQIARLRASRERLIRESEADRQRVVAFAEERAALQGDAKDAYAERFGELEGRRQAARQANLESGYVVEYVDASGTLVRLQSDAQKAYQAEQARKARLDAEQKAAAQAAVAGAARSATSAVARAAEAATQQAAAAREQALREQAERDRQARQARQVQLNVALNDAADAVRSARERLDEAQRAQAAANTEETRGRLRAAEAELRQAQQGEAAARVLAMSGVTDPGLVDNLVAAQDRVEQEGRALAELERLAQADKQRYEALLGQAVAPGARAPVEQLAAARDAYQARLLEAERARRRLDASQRTLDQLVDDGLYALASPEANARRLGELRRRQQTNRDAGRSAHEGFSQEELEETSRRAALDDYYRNVQTATARVDELRRLSDRRDRGETLSDAERRLLEAGPTAKELAILRSERERQARLDALRTEGDVDRKAEELRAMEQWMRALDGARGGRPLTADEAARERQHGRNDSPLERVPRSLAEWEVEQFKRTVAEREREADAADRYHAEVVAPALARTAQIERQLADLDAKAEAVRADRQRQIAQLRQELTAARLAGEPSPAIREREERLRDAVIIDMDPALRSQQAQRLTAEVQRFDQQIAALRDQIRRQAVDRATAEGQIQALEEGRARQAAELQAYQTLPNAALLNAQARQAVAAQRPPEWTYDRGAREYEAQVRTQQALAATVERAQLEEVAQHAVAAARTRAAEAQQALADVRADLIRRGVDPDATFVFNPRRPSAEDRARLEAATQLARDAERGLTELSATYDRRVQAAQQAERAMFAQNARDAVGPADEYDLRQAVSTRMGVDLDREMRADTEWIQRAEAGAARQVTLAQRDRITAEGPSLAAETLRSVEWGKLADPVWVAKTAAAAELGALRGAKDLVVSTLQATAALASETVQLAVSEEARQELARKALYVWDNNAQIARDVTRGLGEAGTAYLESLRRPDGSVDETKIAGDAGSVVAQIYLGWATAGLPGGTARRYTLEELGALAAEESRRASLGFVGRRVDDVRALGQWAGDARSVLGAAAADVRANPLGVAREVTTGLAQASWTETLGRAKAGYGLLDSTAPAAGRAATLRAEAIARALPTAVTAGRPPAPGSLVAGPSPGVAASTPSARPLPELAGSGPPGSPAAATPRVGPGPVGASPAPRPSLVGATPEATGPSPAPAGSAARAATATGPRPPLGAAPEAPRTTPATGASAPGGPPTGVLSPAGRLPESTGAEVRSLAGVSDPGPSLSTGRAPEVSAPSPGRPAPSPPPGIGSTPAAAAAPVARVGRVDGPPPGRPAIGPASGEAPRAPPPASPVGTGTGPPTESGGRVAGVDPAGGSPASRQRPIAFAPPRDPKGALGVEDFVDLEELPLYVTERLPDVPPVGSALPVQVARPGPPSIESSPVPLVLRAGEADPIPPTNRPGDWVRREYVPGEPIPATPRPLTRPLPGGPGSETLPPAYAAGSPSPPRGWGAAGSPASAAPGPDEFTRKLVAAQMAAEQVHTSHGQALNNLARARNTARARLAELRQAGDKIRQNPRLPEADRSRALATTGREIARLERELETLAADEALIVAPRQQAFQQVVAQPFRFQAPDGVAHEGVIDGFVGRGSYGTLVRGRVRGPQGEQEVAFKLLTKDKLGDSLRVRQAMAEERIGNETLVSRLPGIDPARRPETTRILAEGGLVRPDGSIDPDRRVVMTALLNPTEEGRLAGLPGGSPSRLQPGEVYLPQRNLTREESMALLDTFDALAEQEILMLDGKVDNFALRVDPAHPFGLRPIIFDRGRLSPAGQRSSEVEHYLDAWMGPFDRRFRALEQSDPAKAQELRSRVDQAFNWQDHPGAQPGASAEQRKALAADVFRNMLLGHRYLMRGADGQLQGRTLHPSVLDPNVLRRWQRLFPDPEGFLGIRPGRTSLDRGGPEALRRTGRPPAWAADLAA